MAFAEGLCIRKPMDEESTPVRGFLSCTLQDLLSRWLLTQGRNRKLSGQGFDAPGDFGVSGAASRTAGDWTRTSWQRKRAAQQPVYSDPQALEDALARLSRLPPLVTSWEIEVLRKQLAEVEQGRRFFLQGGDCAESFDDCDPGSIVKKLKILLQMSLILVHGGKKPVVRVGRFAGQYAKPRSSDTETRNGVALPSYRGDMINSPEFSASERVPDPERLIRAHERAALTLNFIRSLVAGDLADLHHPEYLDLGFVNCSPLTEQWQRMVQAVRESIRFMEVLADSTIGRINRAEFFTSHEGLHLLYEQALTREVPRRSGWYNLSTHFPWIGDRTRALEGAHIEYFRGIANPIGVKIGPDIDASELVRLVGILNPSNDLGRLTLIHRFGAQQIGRLLPPLIEAVQRAGKSAIWCCDPMHGNTEVTSDGVKTRSFEKILMELDQAYEIHERLGTTLGGVHFELTGEDVSECTGGSRKVSAADLHQEYKTLCDPRLNYDQSLEMAMLMSFRLNKSAQARAGRVTADTA